MLDHRIMIFGGILRVRGGSSILLWEAKMWLWYSPRTRR